MKQQCVLPTTKTVYSYHGSTIGGYPRIDLIIETQRTPRNKSYSHLTAGLPMPRCQLNLKGA